MILPMHNLKTEKHATVLPEIQVQFSFKGFWKLYILVVMQQQRPDIAKPAQQSAWDVLDLGRITSWNKFNLNGYINVLGWLDIEHLLLSVFSTCVTERLTGPIVQLVKTQTGYIKWYAHCFHICNSQASEPKSSPVVILLQASLSNTGKAKQDVCWTSRL